MQRKLDGRNHLAGGSAFSKVIVSEQIRPPFLIFPCSESKKRFSKENGEGKGTLHLGAPNMCYDFYRSYLISSSSQPSMSKDYPLCSLTEEHEAQRS